MLDIAGEKASSWFSHLFTVPCHTWSFITTD